MQSEDIQGTCYWMLAGHLDGGTTLYSDYDGYTIYNDGGAAAEDIINHAAFQNARNVACT